MRKMTAKELAKAVRNGKGHRGELREAVEEIINIDSLIDYGKITVKTQKTHRKRGKSMRKYRALVSAHGPNFYFAIREVGADTIEELQEKIKEIIDRNNIPADTWTGGQVFDESGDCIGRINHSGVFRADKK